MQKQCQMQVRMPVETRRALKIVTAHMNLKKMKNAEGRTVTVTQVINMILSDYLKKHLYKEKAAIATPAVAPITEINDSCTDVSEEEESGQ